MTNMVNKTQKNKEEVKGWEPPRAIHPGAILRDMLEENDITQKELADRTGISKKTVNKIVNEKHSISQETAFKLAKIFEEKSKFWTDLQEIYESNKTGNQ